MIKIRILMSVLLFMAICLAAGLAEIDKRIPGIGFNRNFAIYKRMLEKRLIDPMTFGYGFSNLK
uniref:Secreted peptide prohormone 6 n=1 Tax=Schmidtea mediterranea TaxID=79327 RepID=E3T7T9_SCHMD|nr:secreted peptide prohormone 6 [Schmidtea mediterranea]